MKNEKGLTLVEVLAAITISTVVLGVAFMLLSATNQLSRNNELKFDNDAEIRRTMDTIAEYVSDSNQAYVAGANELRFISYAFGEAQKKSLVYNPATQTLTLFTFNSANLTDYANPSNTSVYEGGMVLSTNAASLALRKINGTALLAGTNLIGGSTLKIGVTFNQSKATVSGITASTAVFKETSFKLLQY